MSLAYTEKMKMMPPDSNDGLKGRPHLSDGLMPVDSNGGSMIEHSADLMMSPRLDRDTF